MKIKGLNLGGWLVLEKWMTPELFHKTKAEDEYHLLKSLGMKKNDMLKQHRDTFITFDDLKWIKEYGIDTVRLPIGYWAFKAEEPYVEAKEYIDNTFRWAEELGLNVVIDVHAAPGCQNGFDNGGLSGVCDWHKDPLNIEKTINFIEEICVHYQNESSLSGIQVLNEPRWDIPMKIIQDFYIKSYNVIRNYLSKEVYVIFHDGFRLNKWESFFKENHFENVILDTHMYQVFSHKDSKRTVDELLHKVSEQRSNELSSVNEYVDIVVGEWSLGIHQNTLNLLNSELEKNALYKEVGSKLLETFEQVRGWFFWNYKLSEESTKNKIGWSFKDNVQKGFLPIKIKE